MTPRRSTAKETLLPALALVLLFAGCAARQSDELKQARDDYERATTDQAIQKHASVALHETEKALRKAEAAWEDEDREEMQHHLYIFDRRLAVAEQRAKSAQAERELEQLRERRDEVLLQAREQELSEKERKLSQKEQTIREQAEELAELKAERKKRGLVITLGDILFEVDRAKLKPGAQQNLGKLVQFLKEHPERELLIEGHTDSTGSDSYNQQLSEERALSVQRFLVHNGIDPTRILTRGYGEAFPVAPNSNAAGRQENRRVEVVVLDKGEDKEDALRPSTQAHQVD